MKPQVAVDPLEHQIAGVSLKLQPDGDHLEHLLPTQSPYHQYIYFVFDLKYPQGVFFIYPFSKLFY